MQLSARRFHPLLFWSVVLATSTAGTTMSDLLNRTLGLGYATGASLLAGCLALVLLAWRLSEKSISVSNIASRRAEGFYWTAVLFSNTLGTALGDFLADDSGLGFTGGALLIGSLIALTALATRIKGINRVILFWIAFVLTRPFGATFGDLLTKPLEKGGLGFGTVGSSLVLFTILATLVALPMLQRRAQPASQRAVQPPSTGSAVPVICAAASEARNTTISPSCSGVTNCNEGCFSASSARAADS